MQNNVIEGILVYAKVTEPVLKYQSEDKEFSISIVVDEDTYDAFGERFAKQSGKSVKTSEFEQIYKIAPPYPNEKKQYILALKKPAQYKDGNMIDKKFWPKVLVQQGNAAVPLEQGIKIANGSRGKVSFEETSNTYGTFARLRNVLVTNLIEYKEAGGDGADDFGLTLQANGASDFADDGDGGSVKVPKAAAKPAAKKAKPAFEDDLEDSDMSPF